MVARINIGRSLRRSFFYNEHKVKEGVAHCLMAANYPMDALNSSDNLRLKILERQAALNERIKANCIHISLNFDPSEQLSNEKLRDIANNYMDRIGFGEQPYLVYRHEDAGHPHIHIVTIKTDRHGKGIPTHNIAKEKSEPARKEIERKFGLVPATSRIHVASQLEKWKPEMVTYGKKESKKAISAVLNKVMEQYKFSSLPELNAILNLYRIHADPGSEGSRIRQHNGLNYHITDTEGNKIGVPIKASLFYNQPTLANLRIKFLEGKEAKNKYRSGCRNSINKLFLQHQQISFKKLLVTLEQRGIHAVLRISEQGKLYGITYVDHNSRCVFNGSELGKDFSAKAILERCASGSVINKALYQLPVNKGEHPEGMDTMSSYNFADTIWHEFLKTEEHLNFVPYEWKRSKKRRRKINR